MSDRMLVAVVAGVVFGSVVGVVVVSVVRVVGGWL